MHHKVVTQLILYPIKGLPGVQVQEAKCLARGLEGDRSYMIVDLDGHMISQRTHPILTQINTLLTSNGIQLTHDKHSLTILPDSHIEKKILVKIWSHTFEAYHMPTAIDQWLTHRIGQPCHLVYMNDDIIRNKSLIKHPSTTQLSFADGYPYLILGQSSVDLLNSKLENKINIDRFRANIIFTGGEPHQEDQWDKFQIGSAKMRIIKPCVRCQVINIDQQSGISEKEPIKTLATYRKFNNGIQFGANAITLSQDHVIRLGDHITFKS